MTFAELKAAIGTWMGKDTNSLPDSIRGQLVNMAIQEYCRKLDLRWNEYSASVSALVGVAYAALPTGYSRPLQMYYLDSNNNKVDVNYLDREEFIIKYPDPSVTGPIAHYTVWAEKIWFGPTPEESKTLYFDLYRILDDLSAEGATNSFTIYAWPLVLFRSCALASIFGIEDNRIPTWQGEAARLENELLIEHSRARSVGRRPVSRDYGYTGKG